MDYQMLAYFKIDQSSEHFKAWGERHVVTDTVGGTLASAAGGYIISFGRAHPSGRCMVLLSVSESAAKLFDTAPEAFMESVFSEEDKKKFGILDLTVKLRGA
jgi:hypothetical protein